ncbi:hypothetical protein Micbo1qcDRAFT_222903 [Microdochium bolleyi]|uniref:2EXR domain-containing protein n=1 Tax=Microdochium bolleyi TaxID=196109 RepID=A0A136J855_9PEZI|nr:hypothetical protein Micbo1qcDRAFT_222903 [Microdochium bolleyi]
MAQNTTITTAGEPTSFNQFSQLPSEIRIKIWQYSLPEPRFIAIRSPLRDTRQQASTSSSLADALAVCLDFDRHSAPIKTRSSQSWRSTSKPPALLHVSAEARHEALRYYKLSLGANGCRPQIYIDFSRDTLFFGDAEIESYCDPLWSTTPDLKLVRRLAIVPEGAWRVLRRWQHLGLNSVEKLVFVHGSEALDPLAPLPPLIKDVAVYEEMDRCGHGEKEEQLEGQESHHKDDRGRVALFFASQMLDEAEVGLGAEVSRILRRPSMEPSSSSTVRALPLLPLSLQRMSRDAIIATITRQQDARLELATLMMVLPTLWSKQPRLATAIFQRPGAGASIYMASGLEGRNYSMFSCPHIAETKFSTPKRHWGFL